MKSFNLTTQKVNANDCLSNYCGIVENLDCVNSFSKCKCDQPYVWNQKLEMCQCSSPYSLTGNECGKRIF